MNETTTTVRGTIITDPVSRRVGESTVRRFRVASNSRYLDRESGQWKTSGTLYLGVSLWDALAEVSGGFVKGDAVLVQGRITTNEYEKDGVLRSDLEMRAVAIGPDLSRMAVTKMTRRPREGAPAAAGSSSPESGPEPVGAPRDAEDTRAGDEVVEAVA